MRFARTAICVLMLGVSALGMASDVQTRVYGGKDAPASKWPWMAAVLNVSDPDVNNFQAQFCGGVRISRQWILSAAHCFKPKDESETEFRKGDIAVLLDTVDLCDDCTSGRLDIERIVIHPDWNDGSGPVDEDDIALLQLANPDNATSSTTASVIDQNHSSALPDSGNDGVQVLGWGATAPNTNDPDRPWFPKTLQQVALDFVPLADCRDQYGDPDELFSESMICAYEPDADDFEQDDEGDTSPDNPNVDGSTAGEDTFGEDTCAGDSGGPLFVNKADADWVAGITSWGAEPCGNPDKAGVYTEVLAGKRQLAGGYPQ
jgi:secreted trypsin-like serine protease